MTSELTNISFWFHGFAVNEADTHWLQARFRQHFLVLEYSLPLLRPALQLPPAPWLPVAASACGTAWGQRPAGTRQHTNSFCFQQSTEAHRPCCRVLKQWLMRSHLDRLKKSQALDQANLMWQEAKIHTELSSVQRYLQPIESGIKGVILWGLFLDL